MTPDPIDASPATVVVLVIEAGGDGVVVDLPAGWSVCACRGCLDSWGVPRDAGRWSLTWASESADPTVQRVGDP